MRGIVNPRTSAGHRLACTALYRHLLKHSSYLPLQAAEIQTALKNIIQNRFRLDRNIQSPHAIVSALQFGRKNAHLIADASHGGTTANEKLTKLVTAATQHADYLKAIRAHQHAQRNPTVPYKLRKVAHLEDHSTKAWKEKIPNPIPIFDRPVPKEQLPDPSRPRKVPKIGNMQGIPFLRYKSGEQPVKLSMTLKSMYNSDVKLLERERRLEEEVDHARMEDVWDMELEQSHGVDDGLPIDEPRDALSELMAASESDSFRQWSIRSTPSRDPKQPNATTTNSTSTWTQAPQDSRHEGFRLYQRQMKKREVTAQKMLDIVHKERALAVEEKEQARQERRARWLAGQKATTATKQAGAKEAWSK